MLRAMAAYVPAIALVGLVGRTLDGEVGALLAVNAFMLGGIVVLVLAAWIQPAPAGRGEKS